MYECALWHGACELMCTVHVNSSTLSLPLQLLVKMVNRLVREEIIPAEAVSVVAGAQFISIRILVASSAVPIIMLRCERIGVGNVVGTVHACPLETSLVPPATKREIDMVLYQGGGGNFLRGAAGAAAGAAASSTSPGILWFNSAPW